MKLQKKILLTVIIVSFTANLIFLLGFISFRKQSALRQLKQKISNISELLDHVNSGPLYDYDISKLKINLQSFLKDPEIISISLEEYNGDIELHCGVLEVDNETSIEAKTEIYYKEEQIGKITTIYSKEIMNKQISDMTRIFFGFFLFITMIISMALFLLLRKITKPIGDLTELSSEIANGNLEKKINIQSRDEIGILSKSLLIMRDSIKQKIQSLKLENEKNEQTILRNKLQQNAILKITSQEHYDKQLLDILKLVNENIVSALNTEYSSIWFFNESGSAIYCKDLYRASTDVHSSGLIMEKRDCPNYFNIIDTDAYIDANNILIDKRTLEFADNYFKQYGITSLLDTSIRKQGKMIGVLCIEHIGESRIWTSDEIVFAERLSEQIASIMIEKDRQEMVAALKTSEERFRLLANNLVSVMIYQVISKKNGTRKFTYVSDNVKNINFITSEAILEDPNTIYDQISPEYLQPMIDAENHAIEKMKTFEIEVPFILPNKEVKWFQFISTPTKVDDDTIVWDGVEIDITNRKIFVR